MTTIVLRANTPTGLTNAQIDANFTNLNNDKVETSYLANTFPGTANITTLGTITTGTWNATTIAVNRGGTGTTTSTGSGSVVLNSSPTLVTPVLGVASATSINKVAITSPATGSTLTIADGKTLTASNTLTFTGTDASSVAFGAGGTVAYVANKLSAFAATTSAELAGVISDETGSGKLVFGTSPTFTTSILTDSTSFAIANTTATTLQIGGAATSISIGASTGTTTVNNNMTVTGNTIVNGNLTVNGTTTTINSTSIAVDDIAIQLGTVDTPTDTTANGGGIILKGSTDKTFLWNQTDAAWNSSDTINVASGKGFEVAGTSVLNATTLGSGVVNSSLTSVGTIATGTWAATDIALAHGGTNASLTASDGGIVYSTASALAIADFGAGIVYANATGAPTAATAANIGAVVDTRYAMIGTTTPGADNYLYVARTSTSAPLFIRQGSTGDIANFFVSSTAGATSGTSYLNITNTGGINSTGVIAGANGSAAAPGLSFLNDSNTGLSTNGSDILSISTAGSARVVVDEVGDINIYNKLSIGSRDASSGPITALGALASGGSGYMNGTHTNVALTGATGAYALGTIVVASGVVTSVTLTQQGTHYLTGETLTVGAATTSLATTAASGTGTTATLTFAAQAAAPFVVGGKITVAGVTPTGYNGTFTVTACTTTTVSFATTTTGAQTVAGTIVQGAALTNATLPVSSVQQVSQYISGTLPSIRLENSSTGVSAGTELGTVYFSNCDGSANASGDKCYIRGVATGTSGGGQLNFFVAANGATSAQQGMYINATETYNYGDLWVTTTDDLAADATTTFRDSSAIYLRSKYWNGTASANTNWNLLNDATAATAAGNQLLFRVDSTVKLTLTNAGALTAVDNITAYSDIRHKTDIEKIQNPLEKVMALNGYTYTRKETGARQTGVIAQEVQEILPEAVMIAENEEKTLSVAYGNMVGLLIEAIKAQQEQINDLKNQIANLK